MRFLFRKARNPLKALRVALKRKLGWLGVPVIVPYTAYGNREKILITGAVIEDKGLAEPLEGQSLWKNILTMVKRYAGDEIAGVHVKIEYMGHEERVRTNELGLFHTILPAGVPSSYQDSWQPVRFTLLDDFGDQQEPLVAESEVQIANLDSDYMVISDIDDTILISHSTRILKKLRLMLFKNAMTRSPFEGVAAFYRALHEAGEKGKRSIFYVSSSEWNLYDLLVDFFQFKGIPRGTLLLSDARLQLFSLFRSGNKHHHKYNQIRQLFELYYDQDFILIGDSGQRDPEIYLNIAEMFPSRVKAIYIRRIGKKKKKKRLERLMAEARELGVEMIPVHTTTEAAWHAVKRKFIRADQIPDIESEKEQEEQEPVPVIPGEERLP
jgi:phosphatidate phosphatase APP1